MAIDFGIMGKILSDAFDSDEIDIGRRVEITMPDGSTQETHPEDKLYYNIKCHISFNLADNPDPTSIDTRPIIMSINIFCDINVDLQNSDFIYARKLSNTGEVLSSFTGTIGQPIVEQSRQTAIMAVRQNV